MNCTTKIQFVFQVTYLYHQFYCVFFFLGSVVVYRVTNLDETVRYIHFGVTVNYCIERTIFVYVFWSTIFIKTCFFLFVNKMWEKKKTPTTHKKKTINSDLYQLWFVYDLPHQPRVSSKSIVLFVLGSVISRVQHVHGRGDLGHFPLPSNDKENTFVYLTRKKKQ